MRDYFKWRLVYIISLIACIDNKGGIGINNKLPWYLPEDLSYFKKITNGKIILMGRKTFESIGRVLPDRQTIILTSDQQYQAPASCVVVHSIDEFLNSKWNKNEEEIFVVGGANVYEQFLPLSNRLYLTEILSTFDCDAFFPLRKEEDWTLFSEAPGDSNGVIMYTFCQYHRN